MTSTRTRMAAAARTEQLIEVAATLIAEQGYDRFSLTALAKAVGISRAGVSHHVGSKEDLLMAVLQKKESGSRAAVEAVSQALPDAPARAIFDALMEHYLKDPALIHLFTSLSAEAIRPEHPAHGYFADRGARGARSLAPLFPHEPDPEGTALEVIAFMDGLLLSWLQDPGIDVRARWRAFADRYFGRVI